MPRHYMIDIETWDTAPTAVIRAIAIVGFDLRSAIDVFRLIDCRGVMDKQIQAGRTASAETVAWWARQEHPLDRLLMTKRDHPNDIGIYEAEVILPSGLAEVAKFIWGALWTGGEDIRVWSRGSFDIAILEHFLQSQGCRTPWRYSQVRDVRTLDELVPPMEAAIPHHPLSDCLAQIDQVCAALALGKAGTHNCGKPTDAH